MSRKSIIILCFIVIAPIIIYLLWPSDESRIKKLVKQGEEAIEKEDIEKVMEKVSFNYQDDFGLTYIYLKKILEGQFKSMTDVKVEYENLKIKVKENSASAEVDVRVIATIDNQTGIVVGDPKTPAHLKFTLEKERTKWLVIKTEGLKTNISGL